MNLKVCVFVFLCDYGTGYACTCVSVCVSVCVFLCMCECDCVCVSLALSYFFCAELCSHMQGGEEGIKVCSRSAFPSVFGFQREPDGEEKGASKNEKERAGVRERDPVCVCVCVWVCVSEAVFPEA